ncbi:aldose 1-epimerase [Fictibacillus sp. KU28468]|uniref:aldose 1-epimerase n=1 Tax=Fictibacillus sp. KU28468 TaxID=2991053 RepID=UPI00223DFBD9|nr:aldose 1-epimerase [Fictibacillus sp. KU28468]UZJ77775.1 aldose 1-epimerase [Fictibacillus sp. KU28468]
MSVKRIQFLDETAYAIENEEIKAIVLPSQGSNLISILDKSTNTEILRTPKTREEYETRRMVFGTPVLFPPNRIEDAVFEYNGRKYELEMNRPKENVHIHGFVHDKEWSVLEIEETIPRMKTQLRSAEHPDILNQFPHDFTIMMTIEIEGNEVIQTTEITNNGESPMPCGIGYHTTFQFPSEAKLFLDVSEKWLLNERHLPTGKLENIANRKEFSGGTSLSGVAMDDVFLMTENKTAAIERPEQGIKISYSLSDDFTQWVLFTASGNENLLAVEPYSWVTNAPNLKQLPRTLTGFDDIKPKDTKEYVSRFKVERD